MTKTLIQGKISLPNESKPDILPKQKNQNISREIPDKKEPQPDAKSKHEEDGFATQKILEAEKRWWRKTLLWFVVIHNITVYAIVISSGLSIINFWLDPSVLYTLIGSGTITATTYILTKAATFAFDEYK